MTGYDRLQDLNERTGRLRHEIILLAIPVSGGVLPALHARSLS